MNVVGYARVSTIEQATNGSSLEAQRARIEAWATAAGHRLLSIHVDAGCPAHLHLGSLDPATFDRRFVRAVHTSVTAADDDVAPYQGSRRPI